MPVRTASNPHKSYTDAPLIPFELPSFKDGFNDYSQSQSEIKDSEVPQGQDTTPDENGAMRDRLGKVAVSPAFPGGYQHAALGQLKKAATFVKLALYGPTAYAYTESTLTALTGFTFTPSLPRDSKIFQAVGRTYFINGTDQPYYTTDGTTLVMQTGAFPMKLAVPFAQRLYSVRSAYPDRLYFSNPIKANPTTAGAEPATYSISDFGDYSVNYASTPIKNAGFIQLGFDEGIVIVSVTKPKNGILRLRTAEHGIWEVATPTLNSDSTLNHSFGPVIASGYCPAPLSVFTSDNDELHYGSDDIYFYGEVALYQSPRTTAKSGRVHTSMTTIPSTAKPDVLGITFNRAEYIFYTAGSYNDRCLRRNKILDSWSTPYVGWNVSCAFVYNESDGRVRLFAGSSKTTDPYIYELETGTTDAGVTIWAYFADKNTDCNLAGIPKYEAFSQVFYSQLVDSIAYEVWLDGKKIKSATYQVPGTAASAGGVGTQAVGYSAVGVDGDSAAYSTPTKTDSFFTINHGYLRGEKIQIIYRKGSALSHFHILKRKTYFKKGKPLPS